MRMALIAATFIALCIALPAGAQACSAEFASPQCDQLNNDGGTDNGNNEGGGGSGNTCPYYMCGNAGAWAQDAFVWCADSQTYVNCPIAYCRYSPCVGSNCYVTSGNCSSCPMNAGNNGFETTCPRT